MQSTTVNGLGTIVQMDAGTEQSMGCRVTESESSKAEVEQSCWAEESQMTESHSGRVVELQIC